MCKAILALVLLLNAVPAPVLAQGTTSASAYVGLTGVGQSGSATSPARANRTSLLAALQGIQPSDRARSASLQPQQSGSRERNWIGRHPILFGTLVGFGGGFLVGHAKQGYPFGDGDVQVNALIFGGIGAGTGAIVGTIVNTAMR